MNTVTTLAATPPMLASPPDMVPMSCYYPLHRAIVAVDIQSSTTRTNPVKADLRTNVYDLFEQALHAAGIGPRNRDPFTDRGDGILALIHPVDQVPKTVLLNIAIPALARLLADHNSSQQVAGNPEQQLRLRVVIHAGEIHYDDNGCFGEALDIAFRLLDAAPVRKRLQLTPAPLAVVISEDIFRSIVRHGYGGIDQRAFAPLVRVQIAGYRYRGWVQVSDELVRRLPDRAVTHVTPVSSRSASRLGIATSAHSAATHHPNNRVVAAAGGEPGKPDNIADLGTQLQPGAEP